MRYPKKLSKRADEILAARRQTAQERHRSAMAALNEQHRRSMPQDGSWRVYTHSGRGPA